MKLKSVIWHSERVNVPGVAWRDYNSETAFQIYCADWIRKQYQLSRDDRYRWWHHSANERHGIRAGFMAKMMGQSRGMPDMVHFGMRLAIELKVPGGVVSDAQRDWLDYLRSIGWTAEVVYSFESFKAIVLEAK